MEVLTLTIPLSAALVVLFVGGFLYHTYRASGDPLRDSLLPFRRDKETPASGEDGKTSPVSKS
jgi:hypothetical protein